MPYLPSEAAKKSQKYNNIINGDIREYQSEINDLKDKQQVSASVDANSPLRDEDGVLVSFESATPGISLEEDFEEVRLENKQFFFTGQIDNEFTYYFQPIATDDTTDTTTTTLDENTNTGVVSLVGEETGVTTARTGSLVFGSRALSESRSVLFLLIFEFLKSFCSAQVVRASPSVSMNAR